MEGRRRSRVSGNPDKSESARKNVGVWAPVPSKLGRHRHLSLSNGAAYAGATMLLLSVSILVGCVGPKSRLKLGKTAEGEVVEAEGFAPNDPKDILATKRSSLVDAQRNAIEKAVGVFVSGKTMVEKAIAIENNILAKSDGYIKKYDVIAEGPSENNLYRTKIRALVALKDLEKDLKQMSLLKTAQVLRPRVTIDLVEKVDKAAVDEGAASSALQQSLMQQGFVVVQGDRAKEAELVIKGKASSFPFQTEGLGGFVSYRARLAVQVMRPGTQDVVYSTSKEASGLGGNADLAALKSLETVGDVTGKEMGTQLTDLWSKGANALVYVEGVKSFGDVERVRKHLVSQPGVADIALRLYDEGMAQFELQLDKVQLAELAATLEKSQSLPLKVLETTPQSLRLNLP